MKIKRSCQTITCDVCGNVFKQIRPWQVYCSTACRVVSWHSKRGICVNAGLDVQVEVRQLQSEVDRLRSILAEHGIDF